VRRVGSVGWGGCAEAESVSGRGEGVGGGGDKSGGGWEESRVVG